MTKTKLTLTLLAAAALLPAQQPAIRNVVRVHVKPDRAGDFQAAVKDYNAALKKAGWDKASYWWSSLTGTNEFHLVRNFSKYGDMDAPGPTATNADLARAFARIQSCTEGTETTVMEVLPDLSLPRQPEPPPVILVTRVRVFPGKATEYENLLKEEYLPAVRKAGVKSYSVARVRSGGSGNDFYTSVGLKSWADLDEQSPVRKAMGAEAYQRFIAKRSALIVETETQMFRYRPELSYMPGSMTTSSARN
jgi:hypothetical protein